MFGVIQHDALAELSWYAGVLDVFPIITLVCNLMVALAAVNFIVSGGHDFY